MLGGFNKGREWDALLHESPISHLEANDRSPCILVSPVALAPRTPSGANLGRQFSQDGKYQFQSPSSFMLAATSTARMTVA